MVFIFLLCGFRPTPNYEADSYCINTKDKKKIFYHLPFILFTPDPGSNDFRTPRDVKNIQVNQWFKFWCGNFLKKNQNL